MKRYRKKNLLVFEFAYGRSSTLYFIHYSNSCLLTTPVACTSKCEHSTQYTMLSIHRMVVIVLIIILLLVVDNLKRVCQIISIFLLFFFLFQTICVGRQFLARPEVQCKSSSSAIKHCCRQRFIRSE